MATRRRDERIAEGLRHLAVDIDEIAPDPANAMRHPSVNLRAIAMSLRRYGQWKPVVANRATGLIEAGEGTWRAARRLGWETIAVAWVDEDERRAMGYAIADNRTAQLARWNADMLAVAFSNLPDPQDIPGVDEAFLDSVGDAVAPPQEDIDDELAGPLAVAPLSIFDARRGSWRQRKRAWLRLGIRGEIGRAGPEVIPGGTTGRNSAWLFRQHDGYRSARELGGTPKHQAFYDEAQATGASVFDPALCEIIYRWFSPPDGRVLDPFAGGSVRGIVAACLGREYVGLELREKQVEANRQQVDEIGMGQECHG